MDPPHLLYGREKTTEPRPIDKLEEKRKNTGIKDNGNGNRKILYNYESNKRERESIIRYPNLNRWGNKTLYL